MSSTLTSTSAQLQARPSLANNKSAWKLFQEATHQAVKVMKAALKSLKASDRLAAKSVKHAVKTHKSLVRDANRTTRHATKVMKAALRSLKASNKSATKAARDATKTHKQHLKAANRDAQKATKAALKDLKRFAREASKAAKNPRDTPNRAPVEVAPHNCEDACSNNVQDDYDTRMQDAVNTGSITMGAYLRHCAAQDGEPQTEIQVAFTVWSLMATTAAQFEHYNKHHSQHIAD